jgi:hypothetical protein
MGLNFRQIQYFIYSLAMPVTVALWFFEGQKYSISSLVFMTTVPCTGFKLQLRTRTGSYFAKNACGIPPILRYGFPRTDIHLAMSLLKRGLEELSVNVLNLKSSMLQMLQIMIEIMSMGKNAVMAI